jgi:hypothetical protein
MLNLRNDDEESIINIFKSVNPSLPEYALSHVKLLIIMDDPLIDIDMHAKQASKQASKQPFVGHVH